MEQWPFQLLTRPGSRTDPCYLAICLALVGTWK